MAAVWIECLMSWQARAQAKLRFAKGMLGGLVLLNLALLGGHWALGGRGALHRPSMPLRGADDGAQEPAFQTLRAQIPQVQGQIQQARLLQALRQEPSDFLRELALHLPASIQLEQVLTQAPVKKSGASMLSASGWRVLLKGQTPNQDAIGSWLMALQQTGWTLVHLDQMHQSAGEWHFVVSATRAVHD